MGEMVFALKAWLTSGPKYLYYGPSDPYTQDFLKSNAMLYVNNHIRGACGVRDADQFPVGTGRAFLFTVFDFFVGSPSLSAAQFGAFDVSYRLSGPEAVINIRNPITNNSALFHIPTGLGMRGSYADRFGRLQGHVPTGAVLQDMSIIERNPCF